MFRIKKLALKRFCGFSEYEVDLDEYTVFVGPNSGGKTTLLRAIRFCSDLIEILLGDGPSPNYGVLRKNPPQIGLAQPAARSEFSDPTLVYLGKDINAGTEVALSLESSLGALDIQATCDGGNAQLRVVLDGEKVHGFNDRQLESLAREVRTVRHERLQRCSFMPGILTRSAQQIMIHKPASWK